MVNNVAAQERVSYDEFMMKAESARNAGRDIEADTWEKVADMCLERAEILDAKTKT